MHLFAGVKRKDDIFKLRVSRETAGFEYRSEVPGLSITLPVDSVHFSFKHHIIKGKVIPLQA